MILGVDISHHQPTLDLVALRNEGVEFAFIKSTEGASYVDPRFFTNLRRARAAGLIIAAYHYVRSSATAAQQVANVRRVVPLDVPVIPDVEANSGTLPRVRDLIYLLREAGYHVPLLYLPRWYWQELGRPSLDGLPPLWSSRYPDNVVDDLRDELARVPTSYWDGYGGLDVTVLQFTSSARIAGYSPLDANAFRGDRAQLAALLGREDTEVSLSDETFEFVDSSGQTRTVRCIDALANLYIMTFFGSSTTPWTGPSIVAMLKDLVARQLADVDEVALAAELEARGVVGITPAQVKEVVQAVFRDAGTDDEPVA